MKTTIATAQFVVGKNATVTATIANAAANMQALLDQVMAGTTVGILINNPVNKKVNIEEATAVVEAMNGMVAKLTADATKQKAKGAGNVGKRKKAGQEKPKFASREEWAKAQDNNVSSLVEHKAMDRAVRNSNVGRFQSHAITVAEQRFMDLGEYPITVLGIEWFPAGRKGPVGSVTVQLPQGYADVSFYDNVARKRMWYDFCDFQINGHQYGRRDEMGQSTSPFNPHEGSGELTLPIWERKSDGTLMVFLPKTEHNGNEYDVLRCRDIRFGTAHSDNNRNLEAAIAAYVRFYAGEFTQANPKNRHGIAEDCSSCKFNMYVPGYDGMDESEEGFKNTLNTSDTIEMVQWGNEIPRRFCMVNRELVDLEIVKEVNEIMANDGNTYYDEEGTLRYARPNEIIVAGKAVNKYVALKQGMMDQCANCSFYHNNQAKTEKQVSKEKMEGKEYVAKYWSEPAFTDRMPIQSLVYNGQHHNWVNQYPGEVEQALDFRVYGIGGVVVYGSEEIVEAAVEGGVLSFVPMMEEENVIESRGARIVEIIHQTCNNYRNIKPGTLDNLMKLIAAKPEGISDRMSKRWDGAVARLAATISEYAPQ